MDTLHLKPIVETLRPGSVHMVGDGFHVRNLFPSNELGERISPFFLLDYAGPTYYPPRDRPRGVGEHPHRGFETVTIVYQGRVAHRDSAGNSGVIGPGDVQWMTAASGIVHEELHDAVFTKEGGTLQMVQLWVNLPAKHKMSKPKYQAIAREQIPEVAIAGDAVVVRVIAGELRGVRGPADTFTPMNVWDVRIAGGQQAGLQLPGGHNAAVVVLDGRATVNGSRELGDAEMALLDSTGEHVTIRATAETQALLLSGEPLGEPIVAHGPFVMNTGAEIYQAVQDYQTGRMGRLT